MPRHTVRLLVTLALAILVVPIAAAAQRAEQVPRIGYLRSGSAASQRGQHHQDVFRQGLRELGWAEGRAEWLPALAAELVRLSVDVLVGGGNQAIQALKHATSTIPIVMAVSSDPIGVGLVASLARPGGNITGLSIQAAEVGGKRLELLKEAVPQASRVVVLWNASDASKASELHDAQVAAQALGVTLYSAEVRGPNDFDSTFAVIVKERPDALLTFSDPLTLNHQRRIVDFATRHRLPLLSEAKEFAEAGGLMTYGASLPALIRRAAYYVDRILKGTKPVDLPVEQPIKFELVLNHKTAQALGITFPPTLLVLADAVIR